MSVGGRVCAWSVLPAGGSINAVVQDKVIQVLGSLLGVLFYRCTAKLNRWFDCVHWPWVQAIRSYVPERDPEQLSSDMGSGAAAIAFESGSPAYPRCPS